MKIELIGTPNRISSLRGSLKFGQNFARVCYSEKGIEGVRREKYNPILTEKRLINIGHHSVFDHFNLNLYIDGLPKAMAMVLNNEGVYATSEKSARYTTMSDIPEHQRVLYDKWNNVFQEEISDKFPSDKFPSLYKKGGDGKTTAQKLAQENARYVTSVFTPTKMGYSVSQRQLSILASEFEKFEDQIGDDLFKRRIFEEGMVPFLESDAVKEFRVPNMKSKSKTGLRLFGKKVQEFFGEDVYSANLKMSLACLAQNQRHRTLHNGLIGNVELGAKLGYFVPPIIEGAKLEDEWIKDMKEVGSYDLPQGQIVEVAERGNREDLEMKLRERYCGLPQLEIVRVSDGLVGRYAEYVPEMGDLRKASCLVEEKGCKKGGCHFGPEKAASRLI